jgi:alpha-1,4-digalacturonate transport system permease protein
MTRFGVITRFTLLAFVALLFLFPVYWMFVTAVRPPAEIFGRTLHLWPSRFVWSNFIDTAHKFPVLAWFGNSLVIAILGSLLTGLLDLVAGYAFAKFQFPGREWLFAVFISTLMIPTQVLLIPQFLLIVRLHGLNTMWAVLVPRAAEVYGVFLARQFMNSIPDELLQAARLDGASEWSIFWRIVIPLSKPLMAVLLLITFLARWNDFAWPVVVLKDKQAVTLPVGLSLLQGEYGTDWTSIMVISLVSILPVVVLFLALQRYIVQGITRTGLK